MKIFGFYFQFCRAKNCPFRSRSWRPEKLRARRPAPIDSAMSMADAATALNRPEWGRNKVFSFLRRLRVLGRRNVPRDRYLDAGYFRVVKTKHIGPDGAIHEGSKTLVYPAGVEWIGRLIDRYESVKPAL